VLFVRWAGVGFSWKFGAGGVQLGEVRGKRPGGGSRERIRGVSGDAGRRGKGRAPGIPCDHHSIFIRLKKKLP